MDFLQNPLTQFLTATCISLISLIATLIFGITSLPKREKTAPSPNLPKPQRARTKQGCFIRMITIIACILGILTLLLRTLGALSTHDTLSTILYTILSLISIPCCLFLLILSFYRIIRGEIQPSMENMEHTQQFKH